MTTNATDVESNPQAQPMVLLSERRRRGSVGLVSLSSLHREEKVREAQLLRISKRSPEINLQVAIDPDCGILSIVEIQQHNGRCALAPEGPLPDDKAEWLETGGAALVRRAKNCHATAMDVIEKIRGGTCTNYEDLTRILPNGVGVNDIRRFVQQAGRERVELDSVEGPLVYGGGASLPTYLPSTKDFVVGADVRALDRDGGPRATISFTSVNVSGPQTEVNAFLSNTKVVTAYLETQSDARTLALIGYAVFLGATIQLQINVRFNLEKFQWSFAVVAVLNETDLVGPNKAVQLILDGL